MMEHTHQQTITLTDAMSTCTRDDLHICKLTDVQFFSVLWPWMRQGLEWLKHKNEPRARWLPEHVAQEIMKGMLGQNAVECFLAHDGTDQRMHGFVVAYPLTDPFVGLNLVWFVWMLYLEPYMLAKVLPEFETLARARRFRAWKFMTSREGWKRYGEQFGLEVTEFAMVKEL